MTTYLLEAISTERLRRLRTLEGRQVSVALRDGSCRYDCQLVSIARHGAPTVWLVDGGVDTFIGIGDVVDLWESRA